MADLLAVATAITATTALAASAGLLFIFSVAVMPSLNDIDPASAITVMQRINVRIINPLFVITYIGAPLFGIAAAVQCLRLGAGDVAGFFAAASVLYLVGTLGITFAVNIPLNNRLADVDRTADKIKLGSAWVDYSRPWTNWNHLRCLVAFLSAILSGVGLTLW